METVLPFVLARLLLAGWPPPVLPPIADAPAVESKEDSKEQKE